MDLSDRYLRRKEVREVTGLSDSTICRLEKANKFPQRRSLSDHLVGWLQSEVSDWLASRATVQLTSKKFPISNIPSLLDES
jgi:prophage regulatory protein